MPRIAKKALVEKPATRAAKVSEKTALPLPVKPKSKKKTQSQTAAPSLEAPNDQAAMEERLGRRLEEHVEKLFSMFSAHKSPDARKLQDTARQSRSPLRDGARNRSFSTPPARRDDMDAFLPRNGPVRAPSPDVLASSPEVDLQYQKALRDMNYSIPRKGGKTTFTDYDDGSGKGQKELIRPHLPRMVQKRAKESDYVLTLAEHTTGLAGLALEARDRHTLRHVVTHIKQVSEDAVSHAWTHVADWSTTVLDLIADVRLNWADTQAIQAERMKLSWSSPNVNESHLLHPCIGYNRGTCQKRSDAHMTDGVTVNHICAVCYTYNDRPHPHPARKCNNLRSKESNGQERPGGYQSGKPYKGKKGRMPARDNEGESKN